MTTDTFRRSFIGFLGGTLAAVPLVSSGVANALAPATPESVSSPPALSPIRIDEWDEDILAFVGYGVPKVPFQVHRIVVETDDEVDISFMFSNPDRGQVVSLKDGERVPLKDKFESRRGILVPVHFESTVLVDARVQGMLGGQARRNAPAFPLWITHRQGPHKLEKHGVAVARFPVGVENMLLTLPVRLTKAI